MIRSMRCLARALTAGVGTAMLAGCVSIPSNGPVIDARRVEGGSGGLIQLFPAGPSADAGPGELVREFLRAAPTFTNDHEVARSFLAAGERLTWRPESPVVVYPSESSLSVIVLRAGVAVPDSGTSPAPPRPGERAQVVVRVPVQARIDQVGQYTMALPGTVETRTFDLVGTGQGWRIASLERGILVSRYDFGITFRGLPLYFADPAGAYLVPDVRWFPVSGTTSTPSQLLSALIDGPADWLGPAVVTGVPPGTQPTVNSVKIEDGVATVDLTREARRADARQRRILRAQLERTLSGLGSVGAFVTSVVVTVEQQRFELQPPTGDAPAARADAEPRVGLRPPPQVDPRPVVLDSRGGIARLTGRTVEAVPGLGALAVAGAVWPATDAAGQAYAVLVADRSRLLHAVPSGPAVTLMRGRSLVAPSFDPFGWVWSAQESAGQEVLAGRPEAGVARVRAPWLSGYQVWSLRISREGARAVIVVQRPGGASAVFVAGVVRTVHGVPTELLPGVRLLPDVEEATAASWVDATNVVLLARRLGVAAMPWVCEVGGEAHGTLPVQAVTVTAGNSESDLYVQTASGAVRSRLGSSWSDVPGVRWPAMPG